MNWVIYVEIFIGIIGTTSLRWSENTLELFY